MNSSYFLTQCDGDKTVVSARHVDIRGIEHGHIGCVVANPMHALGRIKRFQAQQPRLSIKEHCFIVLPQKPGQSIYKFFCFWLNSIMLSNTTTQAVKKEQGFIV